jgi:prevent-host-death family protein
MKVANLSEVKDQLSAFVEMARAGEPVRILVRGVPAADLVPASVGSAGGWAEELERRGMVRRGRASLDPELLRPGPPVDGAPSDELVADRRRR